MELILENQAHSLVSVVASFKFFLLPRGVSQHFDEIPAPVGPVNPFNAHKPSFIFCFEVPRKIIDIFTRILITGANPWLVVTVLPVYTLQDYFAFGGKNFFFLCFLSLSFSIDSMLCYRTSYTVI